MTVPGTVLRAMFRSVVWPGVWQYVACYSLLLSAGRSGWRPAGVPTVRQNAPRTADDAPETTFGRWPDAPAVRPSERVTELATAAPPIASSAVWPQAAPMQPVTAVWTCYRVRT